MAGRSDVRCTDKEGLAAEREQERESDEEVMREYV